MPRASERIPAFFFRFLPIVIGALLCFLPLRFAAAQSPPASASSTQAAGSSPIQTTDASSDAAAKAAARKKKFEEEKKRLEAAKASTHLRQTIRTKRFCFPRFW